MFLLLCLFITYSFSMTIKLTDENGVDLCSTLSPEIDRNRSNIIKWCKEDDYCAEIFHQKEKANITIFAYLTEYIIRKYNGDLNGPLLALFCSQPMDLEYLRKELWILTLLAKRTDGHPLQMPNHRLVISSNTLQVKYECMENENCDENGKDLTIIYIIFAFILATTALGACINSIKLIRSYVDLTKIFPRETSHILGSLLSGR